MLVDHLEGVLNDCRIEVRCGVVEATNGNIKALLRRGKATRIGAICSFRPSAPPSPGPDSSLSGKPPRGASHEIARGERIRPAARGREYFQLVRPGWKAEKSCSSCVAGHLSADQKAQKGPVAPLISTLNLQHLGPGGY